MLIPYFPFQMVSYIFDNVNEIAKLFLSVPEHCTRATLAYYYHYSLDPLSCIESELSLKPIFICTLTQIIFLSHEAVTIRIYLYHLSDIY